MAVKELSAEMGNNSVWVIGAALVAAVRHGGQPGRDGEEGPARDVALLGAPRP